MHQIQHYVLLKRIFHVWDCISKLQQLRHNTLAVRTVGRLKLGADVRDLIRDVRASKFGDQREIVWVFEHASVSKSANDSHNLRRLTLFVPMGGQFEQCTVSKIA
jgi:hypothetical protein